MSDLLECGHPPSPHSDFTTGYGRDEQGNRHCYACCAENERASMIADGRTSLYLCDSQASSGRAWTLQNWPGSLVFPRVWGVSKSQGQGFGGPYPIITGRFAGPDGYVWSFRNAGNMQIARCKRTRELLQE